MSADDGYILRKRGENDWVLQHYFSSDEDLPPIPQPGDKIHYETFSSMEEAIAYHNTKLNDSEYGLFVSLNHTWTKESTLKIEKYSRNPFEVEAVQVTADNMEEVAAWCLGTIQNPKPDDFFIKVEVRYPIHSRQTEARPTDWVLKMGNQFKVYQDEAFRRQFHQPADDSVSNVFDDVRIAHLSLDAQPNAFGESVSVKESIHSKRHI